MTKKLLELLAKNGTPSRPKILSGFGAAYASADDDEDKSGTDTDSDEATIYLYGPVGDWDFDLKEFVSEIDKLTAKTIHFRINSPGGDVFDARAIKSALDRSKSRIVCHIDGLAASAASFIMLAADEIRMADGAFIMIHNPWGFAMGTADDFRATAKLLDTVGDGMAREYAKKTGDSVAAMKSAMSAETWYNAEQALAARIVDVVDDFTVPQAALNFNVSAYANAPQALLEPVRQAEEKEIPQHDPLRALYEARLELYKRT